MGKGLPIARRAASDIERAERWWIENRPAAQDVFRADLKGAFTLLARQPGVGVKVGNTRLSGVRRLHLGRIGTLFTAEYVTMSLSYSLSGIPVGANCHRQ